MRNKLLFFCAFFAINAAADTLLESYQAALEHDNQLKSSFYDMKVAQARKTQTVANLLPSLSLNASINIDQYTRFNRKLDESYKSYGVVLRQQLFRPALWLSAKAESKRAVIAQYAYDNAKSELALRLSAAYFNYLFAHSASKLAKSYNNTNMTKLEQVRKSLKDGLVSKIDFLEAKIRADKSFLDFSKAQRDEASARLALMAITGKEPKNIPELTSLNTDYFEHLDLSKYSNVGSNIEYKQQKLAVNIAEDEVKSKQSDFLPTVDFSAQYMDNHYHDEKNFGDKRNEFIARVTFSMPLFTSGFLQARLEEAKYAKLSALSKQSKLFDDISLKQQKALTDFKVALEQTKISKQSLEHAQLYETAMERSHELGLKDLVELNDAIARAYEARSEAIKSASTLINSYLNLEALIGNIDENLMKKLSDLTK